LLAMAIACILLAMANSSSGTEELIAHYSASSLTVVTV